MRPLTVWQLPSTTQRAPTKMLPLTEFRPWLRSPSPRRRLLLTLASQAQKDRNEMTKTEKQ